MTVLWDGTWYRRIAEHGYPATLPVDALGQVQQSEWAFYPLFPLLARALMTVTGLGFPAVASTLALVLGAVAAVLIALLLRRWLPDRLALVALACWCTYLATPTLQLAYTESMALALLAAFLALVLRRSWWAAAAVALVLGLARPIALPLAIVGLAACLQRWHGRRAQPLRRGEATAMAAMLASCGIAGLLWPGLAWLGTGIPDAYTQTMSAWRAGHEIHAFTPWWHNARFFFGDVWGPVLLVVLPVLYLVVVLGPWARPVDLVVRVWLLAYPLYLGAVLDPISSTYRYLLPLFPVAAILVGWGGDTASSVRCGGVCCSPSTSPRRCGGSVTCSSTTRRPPGHRDRVGDRDRVREPVIERTGAGAARRAHGRIIRCQTRGWEILMSFTCRCGQLKLSGAMPVAVHAGEAAEPFADRTRREWLMAAMKPRTGDGPLEVVKEGRGIVLRMPLEGGGRLVVEMTPDEIAALGEAIKGVTG
ncbi:DUF3117 domain-containing protein [Arsenicicoccus piscis]|uniref:Glycosyltransferase RgtA/B/C/D-like domain-containing protein n=2 Tax=Arsenicicoccus piscis TaxID=673954 RepID=A0ABQ6HIY9_9MICO|nr:DUF3117 domain-containing protein [Arsenicicoccus piscis]GMA18445.1 hypothetical protein GCM10025862_04660 [Arsenicicoccus piscis]